MDDLRRQPATTWRAMITHVQDPWFGAVTVTVDREGGSVAVAGGRLPETVVHRSPGPLCADIPIGTRDATRLTLTVSGRTGRVRPAREGWTRRSHRVAAFADARSYQLVPVSASESVLTVDGQNTGTLSSEPDGSLTARWVDEDNGHRTPPDPADAAVGYVLLGAFGAAPRRPWAEFLDALLAGLTPPGFP